MNTEHGSLGLAVRAVDSSDGRKVCFSIHRSCVELNAEGVGDLLVSLARLRARMRPPVPLALSRLADKPVTADPAWQFLTNVITGDGMLLLRHHGAGWLSFVMPVEAIARLWAELGRILRSERSLQSAMRH